MADACVSRDKLCCAEAHGTGTALGDPIEARSLALAVLVSRASSDAVSLCGVKSTCGHAEPAAGLVGLLQLSLVLRSHVAAPNAQLRVLNPHVADALSQQTCVVLAVQQCSSSS
eukprot:5901581-Pleurochrysis_carterae.AAC.1